MLHGQTSVQTPQTTNTSSPVFNQDFTFTIKDTQNARLEATVWDTDVSVTDPKGFLGEVEPPTFCLWEV